MTPFADLVARLRKARDDWTGVRLSSLDVGRLVVMLNLLNADELNLLDADEEAYERDQLEKS